MNLDLHSFPTRRSSDLTVGEVSDLRGPVWRASDLRHRLSRRLTTRERHRDESAGPVGALHDRGASPSLDEPALHGGGQDRKSTRLNSSHVETSYAVFCL